MSLFASSNWPVVVDFVFLTGSVVCSVLYMRIIFEVNRTLPPGRRQPYVLRWTWGLEVFSLHKKLFPHSRVRLAHHVGSVVLFPFAICVLSRGWPYLSVLK